MYGQNRESSVDVARAKLLHKMVGEDKTFTSKSKVDLACLPTCHSALKPHVQRVNHRVALYKRANTFILETPKHYDDEQGWINTEDGLLEPVWHCSPVLPNSLVDLLDTGDREEVDGEEFDIDDDFSESDSE